jgi:hypothetical protein
MRHGLELLLIGTMLCSGSARAGEPRLSVGDKPGVGQRVLGAYRKSYSGQPARFVRTRTTESSVRQGLHEAAPS